MDTGKIFIGFAFIVFSVTLMINPANAAVSDISCSIDCGNHQTTDCVSDAGSSQDMDYHKHSDQPAIDWITHTNLP